MIHLKGKSGIYQIKCANKIYIGSAVCLYTRYKSHISHLRHQTHANPHLQRLFDKYGKDSLKHTVLEFCELNSLINREQYYIDSLRPQINICRVAGSTLGFKMSKHTIEHLSRVRKGKPMTHLKGLNHTPEARKKISDKAKARGLHPSFKAASIKSNKGKKHSKEFRERLAHKQKKISPDQAREILSKRAAGVFQKDIAKEYGISQRLVVRVEKGIGIYGTPDYFAAGNKRFEQFKSQLKIF